VARELKQSYYECHITMTGVTSLVKKAVEELGWKYSAIDGDIILGEGVKQYPTMHYNKKFEQDVVVGFVQSAAHFLRQYDINVLREKVELVVYDFSH